MDVLRHWLLVLLGFGGLELIKQLCERLSLPRFPWRIASLSLLAWGLEHSLNWSGTNPVLRTSIALADDLFLALAITRSGIWLFLEVLPHYRVIGVVPKIIRDLLFVLISALLVVISLQQRAQVDVVGLIATSAVLTAILGLAAQEPLKDLIGGVSLQLERVLRDGDWVELDGEIGRVSSVGWRDTNLRCVDGSRLVLPNTKVTSSVLRNFSSYGPHGHRLFIGLDYTLPPGHARRLMLQLAKQHPLVLDSPAPVVRIASFDDSAIRYEWLIWQKDYGQRLRLKGDLMEQLWYALRREGQSIPFPVRDVRLQQVERATRRIESPAQSVFAELLAAHPLFAALTDQQRECLQRNTQFATYGHGETIVSEGAQGDSMFMICSGQVTVSRRIQKGESFTVAQLATGDVFGEMTLCTGEPRSATVRTRCECELAEIKRFSLAQLFGEDPPLLERFGALVNRRQAELRQLEAEAASNQREDLVRRMRRLFNNLMS